MSMFTLDADAPRLRSVTAPEIRSPREQIRTSIFNVVRLEKHDNLRNSDGSAAPCFYSSGWEQLHLFRLVVPFIRIISGYITQSFILDSSSPESDWSGAASGVNWGVEAPEKDRK